MKKQYYIVRTPLPYKKSPPLPACISTPIDDCEAFPTPFCSSLSKSHKCDNCDKTPYIVSSYHYTLVFYKYTRKLGWSSICLRFSQFEHVCFMVCLISKLISCSDIAFDINTAMVSSKCSNLNIQLSLTWVLQWSL